MKKKSLIIGVIILLVDQISKLIVSNYLDTFESYKIINDFFSITKVYNYGASWNILEGKTIILIIISLIVFIYLIIYQKKFIENKRNTIAYGLVYGGLLGNLVDRVYFGYVRDFLDFKIFGYNYPVFNIADIALVVGFGLLILAIFKGEDSSGNKSRK